jgi:hypothetical protein
MSDATGHLLALLCGSLIGGLVSLGVALLVLNRTRRENEDLARVQASLAAAEELGVALSDIGIRIADERFPPPVPSRQSSRPVRTATKRSSGSFDEHRYGTGQLCGP